MLRSHGFNELEAETLISVIHPDNGASVRVARKLGGVFWRDWVTPGGMEVVVYRFERPVA